MLGYTLQVRPGYAYFSFGHPVPNTERHHSYICWSLHSQDIFFLLQRRKRPSLPEPLLLPAVFAILWLHPRWRNEGLLYLLLYCDYSHVTEKLNIL